jgi:hypothetical protein
MCYILLTNLYYAFVIQKLERELGIKVSSFPELNLLALQFFRYNPEYMDRELTGEEIFKILMERDKDLLTKLYEGTYEEEK